jgi:sarcosine oxidase
MPPDSGAAGTLPDSYWAATAKPTAEDPSLEGTIKTDVCVVGGGYLGLSTALHLAEAGATVALLEAAVPGWGASGRNGGQIIAGFKAERSELIERLGEERAERIFQWSGGFPDFVMSLVKKFSIDCDARQSGWLQPAHSMASLADYKARTEEWQQRGVGTKLVDRHKAASLLGTDWYKGAYYDPRGGRLHPLNYARGLAAAARQVGARLYARSPVTTVEPIQRGFRIASHRGEVRAQRVVLCTNAYSDISSDSHLKRLSKSVIPVLSYMVATRPLTERLRASILPGGETAADLKRLTNHFRLEADGRFLFGGRGGLKESSRASDFKPLMAKMRELFPELRDVPIDYRWSGKVALTLDHLPHLHELSPGLHAALGCNGRGIGMASSFGKAIQALLSNEAPSECPVPITRLPTIPFHGFRLPALHAAVSWKAYLDRAEHRSA